MRVNAMIGPDRQSLREVTLLVDSGAFYTMLPPALIGELGIETNVTAPVVLADSRRLEVGFGIAYIRLMDREGAIPVGVMEVPEPLLGVTALEALGLKIDPIGQTLEHSRPYGPALL